MNQRVSVDQSFYMYYGRIAPDINNLCSVQERSPNDRPVLLFDELLPSLQHIHHNCHSDWYASSGEGLSLS